MKAKKVIALGLAAVLLVCTSVMATVAYFTDSKSVENTFTVGKIEIKLDEAVTNEYGLATQGRTSTGNAYKLIPGHTYVKDPTVTVIADSEESYIRMLVTVNCLSQLDTIFAPDGAELISIFNGYDSTKWALHNVTKNTAQNTRTYEFRYYTTVNTVDTPDKALEPLFESITVPSSITGTQLNTLIGLEINVVAHAMQAGGFANAGEAWDEFTA